MNRLKRMILDPLTVVIAIPLGLVFWLLPVRVASWTGGAIARAIGPRLIFNRRITANLNRAMPSLTPSDMRAFSSQVWDNVGRTSCEILHIGTIIKHRITLVGREPIDRLVAEKVPIIFVSAHSANWEILASTISHHIVPVHPIYRELNNPIIETITARLRSRFSLPMIAKGERGTRAMMQALKNHESLGMMIDQKLNNGIVAPFFGIDAMTTPAPAVLAARFQAPIVLCIIYRQKGCRFVMEFNEPIWVEKTETKSKSDQAILATTTRLNLELEAKIRKHPEQWLWLHNRWPKL